MSDNIIAISANFNESSKPNGKWPTDTWMQERLKQVRNNPLLRKRAMITPDEKYLTDVKYKNCVDLLERQLRLAEFTPSEIREMAMLACIHYEQKKERIDFYGRK